MAPAGALQTLGSMLLAEKLRHSQHKWIRRLWWVPQTAEISVNIYGIHHNHSFFQK
jgi:hypothetical protein